MNQKHLPVSDYSITLLFVAASMLIRNMLRVNPDRRADIDDIASHWWLNLEENMPVIQELPENQVIITSSLPSLFRSPITLH